MSKNHRYSKQKNLQTNPYRDNNGDLTPKYFDDTKNFDQLNDTNKKFHLRGTIKKYGEDLLSENMKDAAIKLGVITAPSPSSNTGSWLTTTAVLANIPKAVVLTLAASEVLKAVGALPTGYNHNHPSAEPTDNSDAVHHRGKRGVGDISERQSITLSNQNCFAVGVKKHPANGHIEWSELYKKCYDEPCHKGQSFVSSDEGTPFSWGRVLKDLEVRSVNNGQMAEIKFSHLTPSWMHKESYPVYHTCNLPLSPRYQHLNECNGLSSAGKYQEALTECNKALEVDPDFTQALEQKAALEELLAALTTIEPSS